MLFTNPYEAKLLAEERIKDGLRAAEQAQMMQEIRHTKMTRRGRSMIIPKLIDWAVSRFTPSANTQDLRALGNTR